MAPPVGSIDSSSPRLQVGVRFLSAEVAVAQGDEGRVKHDGERGRFVWTDVWVHRAGRWQMVATQDRKALARP